MVLFSWDYTNKVMAGSMLILLLLIHSIKLLHTHSFPACNNSDNERLKVSNQTGYNAVEKCQPDCEICNYLIAKDADDSFKPALPEESIARQIFNGPLLFNTSIVYHFTAESRGPPSCV
jgi:hypothetical protein